MKPDQQNEASRQPMRTAMQSKTRSTPRVKAASRRRPAEALLKHIVEWLDDAKAEEIVTIDLEGKSSMGDFMVIATGTSDRHVGAVAEQIRRRLKEIGHGRVRVEGLQNCDWVLIDAGDIIVHVFRPEVRTFYNLEKMWSAERVPDQTAH